MENNDKELKRIKYPHMIKQEIVIWKRFLKSYGNRFSRFRYDVHVGRGIGQVPGFNKKLQDMAVRLTQKRIDVVAALGGETYIIEIKDRAGMSAIGQLMTYKLLYEKRYGVGRISGLIIVAEGIDPDVQEILKVLKIKIFIV